jgi:signal transduction histidine kinase
MSGAPSEKLRSLELEGAERRVRHDLERVVEDESRSRPRAVVGAAAVLFVAIFALRLAIKDPSALVANFYAVPIALVAAELGLRAGLAAAAIAVGFVFAWGAVEGVHIGVLGYVARAAVFFMVAGLVGRYSEARERDLASRREAARELRLRAVELEQTNSYLVQAVVRLEAFAKIARSVGGETDVRRVLALILDHGRGVVDARELSICLRQGDELLVADGRAVAIGESPLGRVLESGRPARLSAPPEGLLDLGPGLSARAAVVVPLAFRGESLGVLLALDRLSGGPEFDAEDEELIAAVAASAATAVATAQSVAKERLQNSIEAAEQARGRWARELHDETLQGLVGLRMLLSSARRSGSSEELGDAIDHTKREIQNLRALIAELRPAALDELGLGPAIETLAERSGVAAGIEVSTRVELGGSERLAAETESTVYRVVQEALTNVAKHAGAGRVRVEVARDNGTVEVVVEDDGRGFDPAAATGGLGLTGMRERVELSGGRLEIRSRPGTRVRARLPVG